MTNLFRGRFIVATLNWEVMAKVGQGVAVGIY